MKEHYLPYPFSLGYATSLLKQVFQETSGFDACALDLTDKKFVEYVLNYRPDILLVDVPTISFPLVMGLLKEIKLNIDLKIVLTGGHVTALARDVMGRYPFIDYLILGEYPLVFKSLVTSNENNCHDIKGLVYRQDGKIIINPAEPQKFNLDELPYPDRADFPIELYHDFDIAGRPCVNMLTSLGCPYNCSFCMPIHVIYCSSHMYRMREPSEIVNEMVYVKEKYGAKQVYFDDDTFAVNRERLKKLCNELISRNLDLPWTAMGDATLDYETLNQLSKAGCVGIKFGVETVSTSTLKKINKTFLDTDKISNFVKQSSKLGIWTHATYIIGLPGDRKEDLEKTINFSKNLHTDSVQFSIATPYPGTPFYGEAKNNDWLATDDWTMYDGANYSVVNYPWLKKEEIENLHKKALKEWYKKALIQEITNPKRAIKIVKAKGTRYAIRKIKSHLKGEL